MSAGSLRERVAEAIHHHRTLANSPSDCVCACNRTWMPHAEHRAHLADAVLAVVSEWLGSDEVREVVALAALGARATGGCTQDAWRALPSQSRDFWREQAGRILAALIDQTKEGVCATCHEGDDPTCSTCDGGGCPDCTDPA